jgi:hypothetical protein
MPIFSYQHRSVPAGTVLLILRSACSSSHVDLLIFPIGFDTLTFFLPRIRLENNLGEEGASFRYLEGTISSNA